MVRGGANSQYEDKGDNADQCGQERWQLEPGFSERGNINFGGQLVVKPAIVLLPTNREHISQKPRMSSFTIAVSSCALFKPEDGDTGVYRDKGAAFPFVQALQMVNQHLEDQSQAPENRFKIVLITTNGQDMAWLNKSEYNLNIAQICKVTKEKTVLDHLKDIKPILYLSTNQQNVREAINAGYGAATMFQGKYLEQSNEMLRVAFDGDGVLFSDESERVFKEQGLEGFIQNERTLEDTLLELGPLKDFAGALVNFQLLQQNCPIRTYLITSRGTNSPGIRALKTLQKNLEINEAVFLSGAPKEPVLMAINPHIFFDDKMEHVQEARNNMVIAAHVPFGVRNE
ncbi:cytosolic 5'-nucleotidase 1A-like [Myxocyprinus asiaticus]|uniref:cytosolic 5'-nucleotidase 1A-like n=1 Tax=Myxocyprinus asiaticus TaxID=70543 RepID=UPI0022236049|nr:cytosolic 5'-nucleotidase 1A-like [Myxocyprinus asiaticus]